MTKIHMIKAEKGIPCVIDYDGNVLLKPQVDVDTLHYPTNGFAVVGKNGKYGYINQYGVLEIPMKYKKAYPFAENGLAFVVCENGLGGYINRYGRFEIDPIYEVGSLFRFGMAAVAKYGEYKYIYKNGNQAIRTTFKYASGFSDCGLAKVVLHNGQHALMDTTSLEVLSLKKGAELEPFKDGSRITKFRKNDREALINAAGDIITGFYDRIIISPHNRLHPFLRNGLWGYLDNQGNEVIPNIYLEASEFTEFKQHKVASVKSYHPLAENSTVHLIINEKDEIIDRNLIEQEKQLLNEKFSKVNRFKGQLALAVKEERDKKHVLGGRKTLNEEQHRDEYDGNEQTDKDNQFNEDMDHKINDVQRDSEIAQQNEVGNVKDDIGIDEEYEEQHNFEHDEQDDEDEEEYIAQFSDDFRLGEIYKVRIYFRNMPLKRDIDNLLSKELPEGIIVKDIKVNYAEILWPIEHWEDAADIENAMYYLLDDVRLGEYTYHYDGTYYRTI